MTPIDSFETALFDVFISMYEARWQDAVKHLENIEQVCRRHKHAIALPAVLLNQVIAYEQLGRDQQVRRVWADLLELCDDRNVFQAVTPYGRTHLQRYLVTLGSSPTLDEWVKETDTQEKTVPQLVPRSSATRFSSHALKGMHPAVIGLSLGFLYAFSEPDSAERDWLDPLVNLFGVDEQPATFIELMTLLESDPRDTVRVYRSLCKVLETPQRSSIVIVFLSWLAALKMEGDGLPHKLSFSPSPPQEQRLLFTLRLLGRLIDGLSDQPAYEGMIEASWEAVHRVSMELHHLIDVRKERGGKKSADVEVSAEATFWRARAEFYFNQTETALERLRPVVLIASRQALNSHTMALKILQLQGQLLEKLKQFDEARTAYLRAITVTTPKFAPNTHLAGFSQVASRIEEGSHIALEYMQVFAGAVRLGGIDEAYRNEACLDLIEMMRMHLTPVEHATGAGELSLAQAYHGDQNAGRNAFMWSMRSGNPALIAGAWTYRVLLEDSLFESSSRHEFDGLMDLLESLPVSGFRLTIQLLVAEGILRSGVRTLRPLAEMLIRRAALTLSNPGYRERGDLRLFYLPSSWEASLSDMIEAAIQVELSASLRPLLSVHEAVTTTERTEPGFDVSMSEQIEHLVAHLVHSFHETGGVDQEFVDGVLPLTQSLLKAPGHRLPKQTRPRGREAFLESYSVNNRLVVLLVSAQGGGVLLHDSFDARIDFRQQIASSLDDFLRDGDRLYVTTTLPTIAVGFETRLSSPEGVEIIYGCRRQRVTRPWGSPISMLMVGDGWTTQQVSLLQSNLNGKVQIQMCHDADEQREAMRGDWQEHDLMMLGVRTDEHGVVSFWESGHAISVEQLVFARGDAVHGLAVIMTPDRLLCHDLATKLVDVFSAGVMVVSDTPSGYEIVCDVLGRVHLLTDVEETARYIKRSLARHERSTQTFCVLYVDESE